MNIELINTLSNRAANFKKLIDYIENGSVDVSISAKKTDKLMHPAYLEFYFKAEDFTKEEIVNRYKLKIQEIESELKELVK